MGIHACRIEITAVQRLLIHCVAPIRLIVRVRTMAPTRCASARQGRGAAPRSLLATTVTSEPDKNAALREESRSAAARDSTCSTR